MEWKIRAAVSGYENVGIPARLRISIPAVISAPPIQQASTGLPSPLAKGTRRSAVRVGCDMPCGQVTASKPSLPGSLATISTTLAYVSGSASPRISTGLLWLQCGGSNWLSCSIVAGDSSPSSPPAAMMESAANTPGPPALVRIVRRLPLGRGCLPRTSAM